MRISIVCMSLLVVPLALMSACSSHVPATVTVSPQIPIEKGSTFFVLAQVQRERIVKSLVDAGLAVSDQWTGDGYSLTVHTGKR